MESDAASSRLTEAQLGIWLGHQRAADPSIYDTAECVLLEGPLDAEAFHRALDATLREAGSLHFAFPERQGVPERHVVPYAGVKLELVDLSGEPDPREALLQRARAEVRRPFSIESGELYRHFLVRLGAELHGWLHVAHHIALDGYGFNLLARRVAERYAAERRGAAVEGDVFSSFEAVELEDRAYQASEARERDRRFWLEELGGAGGVEFSAPGTTALPEHAHRRRLVLDEARAGSWKKSCEARGVGWTDVFLALVARSLHRLTGRRGFVVGLPVMLRLGTKALKVPCMAMNIAPLPIRFRSGDTVLDTARSLRGALARTRRGQRYRYEHLRADRPRVRKPFGPVINVLPFDFPLEFGDLRAEIVPLAAGPVEDLSFAIAPRGGVFEVLLDGHPDVFSEAELDAILQRLAADLDAWLAAPDALTMGAPEVIEPLDPARAVARGASEHPSAPALVAGDRVWSYAELDRVAGQLAARLEGEGVGLGDLVVVDAPRGAPAIVAVLGALYAGAGYVALDPAHPLARRREIVRQVKPRLIVSDRPSPRLGDAELRVITLDDEVLAPLGTGGSPPREVLEETPAYVVFTSGSTGEPKGVVVPRGALAHFVAAARATYGVRAGDRVLQFAPLTFDASVEELFVTWAAGATLVLRDDAWLESMRGFWDTCRANDISVLDLPTAFWHELALSVEDPRVTVPACLRLVIIGGEAALPERVRTWLRLAPSVRLLNTYGPSEATVVATCADLSAWDGAGDRVPIGAPLPGVEARLFDEAGELVEGEGRGGEIHLSGPTLAAGYLGREDLTRARFSRGRDGALRYRTGDRAVWSRGALVFSGRSDDEVKISGYRISPAEIEAVLGGHSRVRAVVVLAEGSAAGGARLVAHVEGEAEHVREGELRELVAASLPAPFVPSVIHVHEALPRTAHGKLDRRRLAEGMTRSESHQASSGAPLGGATAEGERSPRLGGEARLELEGEPISARQSEVLRVWREVLGVERIGLDDDFFARGGTSLQVIQVAARLSRSGAEITVASIFRHPTPRRQSELLERSTAKERGAESPEARGFVPLPIELGADFRPRPRRPSEGRRLLLTGATGFVGVHVLERWLELTSEAVVCVVRGGSREEAWSRLERSARRFGIDLRPHEARVEIVPLDLGSADFRAEALERGVSPCQVVLHAAAQVSVTRDYESLFVPNVAATRELLDCAARWGADFHYVSTIATLPHLGPDVAVLEQFFPAHPGLVDGYQRSKWQAEALCVEAGARGLPVVVHRLARVSGSTRRPRVNAADLAWRVARAAVRIGAWPELDVEEQWTPVDIVAEVLARASQRDESPGARFQHLISSEPFRWVRLRAALEEQGFPLRPVTLEEWTRRLTERADDEDRATLAFFELQSSSAAARGPKARDISAREFAARWPELQVGAVGEELLEAYCRSAYEEGLFGLR